MNRFAHIAITSAFSFIAAQTFAADATTGSTAPATGTTATITGTTSTTTGTTATATVTTAPALSAISTTTATKQPISQGLKSVAKNLEKDPDNKGLQNAQQRLLENQERQETHRLDQQARVETVKPERVARVERIERVERPVRVERPEGGRGR